MTNEFKFQQLKKSKKFQIIKSSKQWVITKYKKWHKINNFIVKSGICLVFAKLVMADY